LIKQLLSYDDNYEPSYRYTFSYSEKIFEVGFIGKELKKVYETIKNYQLLLKEKMLCELDDNINNIKIMISTYNEDKTEHLIIPKPTEYDFVNLCKLGKLEDIENIISTTLNMDLKLIDRGWFESGLANQLKVMKYLYSCKFDIDYKLLFHRASIDSKLKIIKWLYKNKLYTEDEDFYNLFMNNCINLQLKKAKWFIKVKPNIINEISENLNNYEWFDYGKIHYIFNKVKYNKSRQLIKVKPEIINKISENIKKYEQLTKKRKEIYKFLLSLRLLGLKINLNNKYLRISFN